jgi:hypothetical protein
MIDTIIEFLIYAIFPYFKRKKRKKEEWYGKQYHKRSGEDFPDPVS